MHFVSLFCGCEHYLFSMSKRAMESLAASASATQKPVHCTALQPLRSKAGHSFPASDERSVKHWCHLWAHIEGENYTRKFDDLAKVSRHGAKTSTKFTIWYWTVFSRNLGNISKTSKIHRSTLRFGASSRATAYGLHLGLQRITKTSIGWQWREASQGRKIWHSLYNDKWKYWSIAKTHTICKYCRTGKHFVGQETRGWVMQQQNRSGWKFTCSQVLHRVLESPIQIHPTIGQHNWRRCAANPDLTKN